MKIIVFLTIAFAVFGDCIKAKYVGNGDEAVRGLIENKINETLNNVIQGLADPLVISDISLTLPGSTNIPAEVLNGGLSITDLRISGLPSVVASYIKFDLLRASINMTVDIAELYITTKWWADMTVLELVPLYGDGRMSFTFENIQLQIFGSVKLSERISFKNLKVVITLGDALFDLHGLINNEEFSALVSEALNDNFVGFVDDNQEVISNILSPVIESVINAILNGGGSETTTPAALTTPEGSGDNFNIEEDYQPVRVFMEELEKMP